jgi:hypothetical protein
MATKFDGNVICTCETPNAIKVRVEGTGKEFWVPKSVIDDESETYKDGTSGNLIVADWFAEKQCWDA